jgi:hypothetical protein
MSDNLSKDRSNPPSGLEFNPFRINTCKSVSKQMTLTLFRMNTYEKLGGGGPTCAADPASGASEIFLPPQRAVPHHRLRQTSFLGGRSFCSDIKCLLSMGFSP